MENSDACHCAEPKSKMMDSGKLSKLCDRCLGNLDNAAVSRMRRKRTGLVHFYRIIGTPTVVAEVLEPGDLASTHSSVTTVNGKWYGTLGTRVLPKEVDAIPRGDKRMFEIIRFRDHQVTWIHNLISKVAKDPTIAAHCDRTQPVYSMYRYEWSDQIFADFLSSRDSSANYLPVEWIEYKD
jgi:hypothetical protein